MKKKLLASLEIAVVLCSLFLVALPAIAAEQNQATQEVSASTITTASEDDYVLEIYGNANEDDTIDMRDLTYVKLIFFGKKPETELADAKYDGKINPLDFIQIKLIIVGKEKELTVIYSNERAKTFKLPIKRIIAIDDGQGEPLRVLGAEDLVVGVGTTLVQGHEIILPVMSKLPIIGSFFNVDYEKVLSLKPDLFFTFAGTAFMRNAEEKLEPHGVQVLRLDCGNPTKIQESIKKLGYLIGKKDKAEEFLEFHEDHLGKIKERVERLPKEGNPRVFIGPHWGWGLGSGGDLITCTKGSRYDNMCNLAGGINIAHDLIGTEPKNIIYAKVDLEWVIVQNPDIFIACVGRGCGFGKDDATEMKAQRDEIMNRPEWEHIKAVENGNVYVVAWDLTESGLQGFVGTAYMAKWFHPDLFEDLDPQAIHQEYIDRFLRIDYDLDKHGVFIYPPLED
jgi:iron complex transport system substrate-binding protein